MSLHAGCDGARWDVDGSVDIDLGAFYLGSTNGTWFAMRQLTLMMPWLLTSPKEVSSASGTGTAIAGRMQRNISMQICGRGNILPVY